MNKLILTLITFCTFSLTYAQNNSRSITDKNYDSPWKPEFKSQKLVVDIQFNYDSLMIDRETEENFIRRMQEKRNVERVGQGDKWLLNWEADKKDIYERAFIQGVTAKTGRKVNVAYGKKADCVLLVDVRQLALNWGEKNNVLIIVSVSDTSGKVADSWYSYPKPEYSGSTGFVLPAVRLGDSFYLSGQDAGVFISNALEKRNSNEVKQK
jgi:hypothetical protein